MMGRSHHGLMMCTMIGIGVVGAAAVYSMFVVMPPRRQREVKRGLRKAIDDLNDLVEDIGDTVKSMQCHN